MSWPPVRSITYGDRKVLPVPVAPNKVWKPPHHYHSLGEAADGGGWSALSGR